ncbi:hypothetical protein COD51_24770 [Escherichia coli]|nr:hypothetical protein COD51_24770 [Escherichia coli]PBQ91235.1 hypothetical protein COD37_25440 [Escherichia coli]
MFNNCAVVTHLSVAVISPAHFRWFPSDSKNHFLLTLIHQFFIKNRKRKLTAVCSHQTRIGNLDAHLI